MANDAVGDDDFAESADAPAAAKSNRWKRLAVVGLGVTLAVGLGIAVAYYAGFLGAGPILSEATETEPVVQPPKPVHYYPLPEITVNLSSAETRATYLRLNISLEFSDEDMISLVKPNLPRVLDAFQVYLRELRIDDLNGSAGLFRLKEELQRRINIAIYPARVDDILFKDLKVQ